MNDYWVLVPTFAAVATGVAGVYSLLSDVWLRDRRRVCKRVEAEFLGRQLERPHATPLYKDLTRLAGELAADNSRLSWSQQLELLVERAGMSVGIPVIVWASGIGGVTMAGLGTFLLYSGWAALPGAALGGSLPLLYLLWKQRQRRDLLTSQLPDAFENMAHACAREYNVSSAAVHWPGPRSTFGRRIRLLLREASPRTAPPGLVRGSRTAGGPF